MPAEAASRRQVAIFPDLRAHVLKVRSARQNGCGFAGRTFLNIPSNLMMSAHLDHVLAMGVKYSTGPCGIKANESSRRRIYHRLPN